MRLIIFCILFFIISSESFAQQLNSICSAVEERNNHSSVVYKPGVDVHGNAVKPANLKNDTGIFNIPEIISFPLNYDLAKDLAEIPDHIEFSSNLAMIEIHLDGSVYINGENFNSEIQTLCDGDKILEKKQLFVDKDTSEEILQSNLHHNVTNNASEGIMIFGEGN
jgi:hypothetical protein